MNFYIRGIATGKYQIALVLLIFCFCWRECVCLQQGCAGMVQVCFINLDNVVRFIVPGMYQHPFVKSFSVTCLFAYCTLQSLTWLKYWNGRASHEFRWNMAHGAPSFQYYTHIGECRVQMGLEALKQLSFCVNTTVLCLKLLSIKLHHIQLRSCFSAARPCRCGNWSGGYREYNQYGTRQNAATVSNKDVST